MSILGIIALVIVTLIALAIYEVHNSPEQVNTFFSSFKSFFQKAKKDIEKKEDDNNPYDTDFNIGYSQGYKAALISAHTDAMMIDGEEAQKLRDKLARRMKDAMPEIYSPDPDRMALPSAVSVDDDGGFCIEWIFGDQGKDNSWRVVYFWDQDGATAMKTTFKNKEFDCYQNNDPEIGNKLKEWLIGK